MIDSVKGLLKFIRFRNRYIDESVFRLHCLYTPMILLFFFVLITASQLVGEPIDCDMNRNGVKESVLNTYCLIHNTYLIRSGFNRVPGIGNAHPGVRDGRADDEIQYNYYQWIWMIYFIEALCFYAPRWWWKNFESGTISNLLSNNNNYIVDNIDKTDAFLQSYSYSYIYCLVMAFFNVFVQTILINHFFNGEFFTYGIKVLSMLSDEPEIRRDSLAEVFPLMAKCKFRKYGSSGSIQTFDALCVLPLNMYNEKIFIFLWFWFIILSTLLLGSICTKIILLFSAHARSFYVNTWFTIKTNSNIVHKERIDTNKLTYGELFILILIKESKGQLFSTNLLNELMVFKGMSESEQLLYRNDIKPNIEDKSKKQSTDTKGQFV